MDILYTDRPRLLRLRRNVPRIVPIRQRSDDLEVITLEMKRSDGDTVHVEIQLENRHEGLANLHRIQPEMASVYLPDLQNLDDHMDFIYD